MLNRISRDLENLDEDWDSIDFYIYKIIKEIIKNNEYFYMNLYYIMKNYVLILIYVKCIKQHRIQV